MAALSMSGMVILSAGSPPSEMGMNTRNTMSSGYPNEVNIPLRIGRRPVRNSGREMGVGEGGGRGGGQENTLHTILQKAAKCLY